MKTAIVFFQAAILSLSLRDRQLPRNQRGPIIFNRKSIV